MELPLVSCIVPVFNGERFLADALDSILAQTYRPLDIVVVDDGSTDDTPRLLERYTGRVRGLRHANAGAPAARNRGLAAARGELIAFLDADDLWLPEKLERQVDRFRARPELDLCVTHLQTFWSDELASDAPHWHARLSQPLPGYVTQTLLARRALVERVGPFTAELGVGDPLDWFLRAADAGAVMELLPEPLVRRRLHGANLSWEAGTRHMTSTMQDALLRVVKASLDRRRQDGARARRYEFPRATGTNPG